jgi:RecA-family ATPase
MMILGGPAGIGKSFIAFQIGHNIATGSLLFGMDKHVCIPGGVLIVEQEVGIWGSQKRLKERYTDTLPPEPVWLISRDPEWLLDSPTGYEKAERTLEQLEDVGVLVLDPASRFLRGDENSNTDVGRFIRGVDQLMNKFVGRGLAVVLTHHFGKPPQDNQDYNPFDAYNFRGASKWRDAPDTKVTCQRGKQLNDNEWIVKTRWETRHAISPGTVDLVVGPRAWARGQENSTFPCPAF